MSRPSLRFERLSVHRAGERVRSGHGFTLDDLCPGVTIVHGPNGSGKSTTALAMQAVLWPGQVDTLPHPLLEADLRDDEATWHVQIDGAHVAVLRDGTPTGLDVGPVEQGRRYRLALDELLVSENDEEFARAIARASQGGYDVPTAADRLGFSRSPSTPQKLARNADQARGRVKEAQDRQGRVAHDAERLEGLREDHAKAEASAREAARLQEAREAVSAREEVQRLERERDRFDPMFGTLDGDERDRLDGFDSEIRALEQERVAQQGHLRRAEEELTRSGLPAKGADAEVVRTAKATVKELRALESELERSRASHARSDAEERRLRDRLAPHATLEGWQQLDGIGDAMLADFTHRADRVRAVKAELQRRRHRLEQEPEPADEAKRHERDVIVKGISALSQWLASPDHLPPVVTRPRWPAIAAATLAGLLAAALAYLHHPAWLLALLPAVSLAYASRAPDPPSERRDSDVRREDYQRAGLPEPEAWSAGPVSEHLGQLMSLLQQREVWERQRRERADLHHEEERLAEKGADLQRERRELEQRYGITVDLDDEWLPLFLDHLARWQRARDEACTAAAATRRLESMRMRLLAKASEALGTYGYPTYDTTGEADDALEDLEARIERHREALGRRDDALRELRKSIEPRLQRLRVQRRSILDELALAPGQEGRLDAWLDALPEYRRICAELNAKLAIRDDRRAKLADRPDLLDLSLEELERRIAEAGATAAGSEDLIKEITRIERDIETAKRGHDLTDAIQARDETYAQLADAREHNRAAAVGAILTEWVRRTSVDKTRPAVFRRANELLARFSVGDLALSLDDAPDPPRIQVQSGSRPPRPVQRLSVGERIQALTAVRIAFLEQDERYRLPLLLDETLGTTDDARATVIIDAVAELARDGRQIVYFTAQHDERAKWEARLGERGVPFASIDLAAVRHGAKAERQPLPTVPLSPPEPPAPDGRDYFAYGRALDVPAFDPAVDDGDDVHLWHVFDDAQVLYEVLRLDIRTWGQLRRLVERTGPELIPVSDTTWRTVQATARALDAAGHAWRLGRGKPVDRAALEASGQVTDTKLDEVSELAAELDGDAAALVEALENRRVSHWRQAKTEALRTFFEENGHLPERAPLSPDELRSHVLTAVADDLAASRLPPARIHRILEMLPT